MLFLNKIVSFANEEILEKAILFLKDIYIHLGPQLKLEQVVLKTLILINLTFFKIKRNIYFNSLLFFKAKHTAEKIKQICLQNKQLELFMPALFSYNLDETKQFQENFIQAGGVTCFKKIC